MNTKERFAELWTDYLEGELDEKGYEELRQLLTADESLTQLAADSFQTHRLLGLMELRDAANTDAFVAEACQGVTDRQESFVSSVRGRLSESSNQQRSKVRFFNGTRYIVPTLLTGCVLLFILYFNSLGDDSETVPKTVKENNSHQELPAQPAAVNYAATLVFAEDCVWKNQVQLQEGQRVLPGVLQLDQGMAILRFDGGAAAILTGEVAVEIQSRSSARLQHGELVVRAPEEAAGFLLYTPAAEVVDLGTEFAVKVGRDGATEVHVIEGEVAYRKHRTGEQLGELLPAGQAVRYDAADTAKPRAIDMDATRFDELLRRTRIQPHNDSLLAYEPFDYPAGALPLHDTTGGSGWTGSWQLAPWFKPPADDISIGVNDFPVPVKNVSGTMMEAFNGIQTIVRRFEQPLRLDQDGIYFMSVIVRWEPNEGPSSPFSQLRMVLRTSKAMLGDHVMLNLPALQRPQIELRDGEIFTASDPVNLNETQLWVGKIVARQDGPDEVFFRIFAEGESPGVVEPADWTVMAHGVQSDAQLDTVVLSAPGPGKRWFDDVRVGTNWRSVLPHPKQPHAKHPVLKKQNREINK